MTAATRKASERARRKELVMAIAKHIYLAGHNEGWSGNQQRRDVAHVDAEKGWELYAANGALEKALGDLYGEGVQ